MVPMAGGSCVKKRMPLRSGFFPQMVVAFLLLSGCKVGPDYLRPKTDVAPNWLEAEDRRISRESAVYAGWWRAFHDPVLNELVDRAHRGNLSLWIAGVRVLEARAQLGIAIGQFYPQSQQALGSLQYNRISQGSSQTAFFQSGGGAAASGFPSDYWQSQIGFAATWELDFWGKFRRAIESADAALLATVANYDNALVTLTADVANVYIQIRTLEARIRIARENAETQEESLKIAQARFTYGTGTQLDVEQARTALYTTNASVPSLEIQLRQAQDALSVLLGLPPGGLSDLLRGPSRIPVSPPEVIVGIPADLLRRRPDVRSAEFQAAAQSAQIGVAKADLYPALSLSGNLTFVSTDIGRSKLTDMFRWGNRAIQAGPLFSWNLFNYGRLRSNVRLQDARFQELLLTYQNAVLAAQQDVEDNLGAFLKSQDRADLLAQSVGSARTSLNLAVLQYREGIVNFTTVLTAQQALLGAQDSLAATLGTASSSLVGVYRALGGGWEIREGKDLVPPEIKEQMERRTDWNGLLSPASYNPPAGREPRSAPRLPDW